MIHGIEEINLPSYATLKTATITMQNMGDQTIEATLSIDRDITPDFSTDWIVKFRGVEFVHPLRTPQASKSNDKFNPEYPLTFYHKGIYDLKRKFFFTYAPIDSGTAVPDKYDASLSLNVVNFVDAYRQVLEYHYGDYITIDLNPSPTKEYDQEPTNIAISYTKMWALLSAFYDNYKVSWWIEPKTPSGYVIKVGYDRTMLPHQFEYGYNGGLLKMERQVQSPDIINIMLGRGGTKNLPYRYFKDRAADSGGGGDEATFEPDPDFIPELANISFDGLRDINFRYWVQGWKDKGGSRRYATGQHWAYDLGYAATKFDPVEYVRDLSSIAKYGELWGGLQKVEDIYPSIQGVTLPGLGRIDQIVDTELPDESQQQGSSQTVSSSVAGLYRQFTFSSGVYDSVQFSILSDQTFTVNEGYIGNLTKPAYSIINCWYKDGGATIDVGGTVTLRDGSYSLYAVNVDTGEATAPEALVPGTYRYLAEGTIDFGYPISGGRGEATLVLSDLTLTQSVVGELPDVNAFTIWVKNIWETSKLPDETDKHYAERVWKPILGDYLGSKAAVVFSSGYLSISEDYEFLLTKIPEYDTSKRLDSVQSHWRITLKRSDAEYDATGEYLPNDRIHANAGEYFFFIGIDMPHQYVVWAEQRLNAYKLQQLDDVSEINPTWAIELSKVRIGSPHREETESLISQLGVGVDVTLYSKWFVSNAQHISEGETFTTTIQTLTFKYEAPKKDSPGLLPSVSVTLADKPMTTTSSISLLQGSVDALTSRINSMSAPYVIDVIKSSDVVTAETDYNVYSAKKARNTLLSSTNPDVAEGHIMFKKGITTESVATLKDAVQFGEAFVSGKTGMGGFIDPYANAELESLTLRSWLEVPEIRFNRAQVLLGDQWQAPGGGIVESVVPDVSAGEVQPTGTITLKLEEGEIGAVAVGDICKGYFHDFKAASSNATADADDGRGNTTFAGFCTVYFYITEIIDDGGGANKTFKYALRPVSERWRHQSHPYQQMHFVAYGNFNDPSRQKSAYQTRTYTRYLKGVDDWEFTQNNIAMQFGDLQNLSVFGMSMQGYSAYLHNVYYSGSLEAFHLDTPLELTVTTDTGDFRIDAGGSLTLTCSVGKALSEPITDYVTAWTITRDSGSAEADAAWNAAHPMYSPMFTLTQGDIGATSLNASALFTITAEGPSDTYDGDKTPWSVSKTVAVRTLRLTSPLSMRFESEYGAQDTFITFGDTVQFHALIEDGLRNDFTSEYDQWRIERHNGDTAEDIASDGVWNATRASISSGGIFSIEWSAEHDDLQSERATFVITAQKGSAMDTQISATLSI